MLTEVLARIARWEHLGSVESEEGSRLVAHTPRDFPQAYLHTYLAPASAAAWNDYPVSLPPQLRKLYSACNGIHLFGAALSVYGIRSHHRRDASAQWQPFDLASHHAEWSRACERAGSDLSRGTVFFGSYMWDGSGVYVVGESPEVHRSLKGSASPINTWPDIPSFLLAEYDRLHALFSPEGYLLDESVPTIPLHAP